MRYILLLMLIVPIGGCAPAHLYSLKPGRYILKVKWGKLKPVNLDIQITENAGHLKFLDSFSGSILATGERYNNTITFGNQQEVTYTHFKGELTADNHIEGSVQGRIVVAGSKAYKLPIKKGDTSLQYGTFSITPYKFTRSASVSDFFMKTDAPPKFNFTLIDPRAVNIIVGNDGKLYEFSNIKYNVSGNIIKSFDKKEISTEEFEKMLHIAVQNYGFAIPVNIYPQKGITFGALKNTLNKIISSSLYRVFLMTLNSKWGCFQMFYFELYTDEVKKKLNSQSVFRIKFTDSGCLHNDQPITDLEKTVKTLRAEHKYNEVLISGTGNAKISEIIKFNQFYDRRHRYTIYLTP